MAAKMAHRLSTLACIAFASIGSSCNLDPVHHAAVASLGDEDASRYPVESAYHRPGEPCVLCHSDQGDANRKFALAGTVFWGPNSAGGGVGRAYVRINDSNGGTFCVVTNCAGNFFIEGGLKYLAFPLAVSVFRAKDPLKDESALMPPKNMNGHIGREPSCGNCHLRDIVDFGSPGNIRMYPSDEDFNAAKAKGDVVVDQCPPPANAPVVTCPENR